MEFVLVVTTCIVAILVQSLCSTFSSPNVSLLTVYFKYY